MHIFGRRWIFLKEILVICSGPWFLIGTFRKKSNFFFFEVALLVCISDTYFFHKLNYVCPRSSVQSSLVCPSTLITFCMDFIRVWILGINLIGCCKCFKDGRTHLDFKQGISQMYFWLSFLCKWRLKIAKCLFSYLGNRY